MDSRTAVLPAGWRERLTRLQSERTGGRVAYCLDVLDLFLSKCAANREKDRLFNRALLAHGFVKVEDALPRLSQMPLPEDRKVGIAALIVRLAREAGGS